MTNQEQDEKSRYLIFRLASEIYGTPLLGVREVVEYQKPKVIPNTVDHCAGVINIRGEVIAVIDLRMKLGHPSDSVAGTSMLVFSNEEGSISAIVDKVEAVISIPESEIEKSPNVSMKTPSEFLIGIGKYKSDLITLIDLQKILKAEEIMNLRNSKLSA